jgi:hypothetical protein
MTVQFGLRAWWMLIGVVVAATSGAACAGGDAGGGPDRLVPQAPITTPSMPSAGAAGSAGDDGFGNSNTPVVEAVPTDPSAAMMDAPLGPDEEGDCGGTEIEPTAVMEVVPGNVLVIFDASLSMLESWSGSTAKWDAATQAVSGALMPLQDQINAATLFFPSASGGFDVCGVSALDSGSQIDFQPGAQFMSAWNQYLSSHGPAGFTPTGTAMQMAETALNGAALAGTTAVVVITDGDPNCGTDDAQVNQIAAGWLAKGIKTHVIGLPGTSDAGDMRLTALATAGGSNAYLTPSDGAALQATLSEIVGASVTSSIDDCRIALPEAPPNPDDVTLVVLEGGVKQAVDRDLGTSGGWALDVDSLEITLQGALCDQAKLGTYEKISVAFGCVDLPPLPPPPPVI